MLPPTLRAMLPPALKADIECHKPTTRIQLDSRTESIMGIYVDCVSGALRFEDEGRPDHNYAKSSIWRPPNYMVKPCRYLFLRSTCHGGFPQSVPDRAIDVETVDEEYPVPVTRAPRNVDLPDEEPSCWVDHFSKTSWSPVQIRILPKVLRIMEDVRLHRLVSKGRQDEHFHLEEALERGRSRLSRLLSGVGWDSGITRWLHSHLMKHLLPVERGDYLAMLGRLKRRVPGPVEAMTAPGVVPVAGPPPLDQQVANALLEDKFCRLPHDPLFFMVPNSLECSHTERFAVIVAQLRQMAQVSVVAHPPRGRTVNVQLRLDQMVAETRARLAEVSTGVAATRPIVLIGWNLGAAITSLLAQLEPARAVVCIGYPQRILESNGGRPSISITDSQCPVMFIMGANSRFCGLEEMEELRSRMRVLNHLVVLGGCDDRLMMGHDDRSAMQVTQSMVDRAVVGEIYNFLGETLTQPVMLPPGPLRFPAITSTVPYRKRGLNEHYFLPSSKQNRPHRSHKSIDADTTKSASLVLHHNYPARQPPVPAPPRRYQRLMH